MNLYQSKPTLVEAVQWTGSVGALFAARIGVVGVIDYHLDRPVEDGAEDLLLLAGKDGAQGYVPVPLGHWIVRNPGDETDYWPVDPAYFAAKYEAVV